MAGKGGARPGAGRKPGVPNRRTVEREQAAAEALERVSEILGLDAFEGDAVALMQFLYKNPQTPLATRFEAAKVAAPFERPKLAAVEVNADHTVREITDKPLTNEQWAEQHADEA